MLATLLDCDVAKFNDRDFKENYYVCFPECKIFHKRDVPPGSVLSDNKFSRLAKALDPAVTEDY